MKKHDPPVEVVRAGDLIPDARLLGDDTDLLDHRAIANGVADIAWKADAPVNIALFGPWGSGKSSVYAMIERRLTEIAPGKFRIARYDAWKYGGHELKRNFIDSISNDLNLKGDPDFNAGLHSEQSSTQLQLGNWLLKNKMSLLGGLALAVVVGFLWVIVQAFVVRLFTKTGFQDAAHALLPQAGTVFGLALVAMLVGPKVLEGAIRTTVVPAPEGADQFAQRFSSLVKKVRRGPVERLVVFIDELDRCRPTDVVATLVDLKTFLDHDNCVFIVAADREVIESALREVPQAKPVRDEEPYYATPGAFLDKIFQHQIALPPLRSKALTQFANDLVGEQRGVWGELRDLSEETFERTIFALVPVHVRSPRRVKVLLNNYATTVRIAESRGIDWRDRAHELAVLTVLQTEFPPVADDLRRLPRLLAYVRGDEEPLGDEPRTVTLRYALDESSPADGGRDPGEPEDGETAAGRLLSDSNEAEVGKEKRADQTLRRQLATYLAKVRAANIDDPRPDLLYLQGAAGREDLGDPRLGDAIDYATDTAPEQVYNAFVGQPTLTIAVAVPLLVIEGDQATGTGRSFAYEAACRLTEHLEGEQLTKVAAQTAPSIMAAAATGRLPTDALPGALLLAVATGNARETSSVLSAFKSTVLDRPQLRRLARIVPQVGLDEQQSVVRLLVADFLSYPELLGEALASVDEDTGVLLWDSAREHLMDLVTMSEDALSAPPAPAAASRSAQRVAAVEPAPDRSGGGVSLLDALVETVRSSSGGGEKLVSAILATAQQYAASPRVQKWVQDNIDALITTMTSPERRALHGLYGLINYPYEAWPAWSPLVLHDGLDTLGPSGIFDAHARAALGRVIEAVVLIEDPLVVDSLPALAEELLKRVAVEDAQVEAAVAQLREIVWPSTSSSLYTLVKARRRALHVIAGRVGAANTDVCEAQVEDIMAAVRSEPLSDDLVAELEELTPLLPKGAARLLVADLDDHEPAASELASVLGLELQARLAAGEPAPPATRILAPDAADVSTRLTERWLHLQPVSSEVAATLGKVPFSPAALTDYCVGLRTEEVDALWVTAIDAGAPQSVLSAVGKSGVGEAAVENTRTRAAATRQDDRRAAVSRLTASRLADAPEELKQARRAASQLAAELLDTGVAGNLPLAAEVILWAGGAAHGSKEALRGKFTEAVHANPKALNSRHRERLASMALLERPRQGWMGKFLGG